MSQLPVTSYPSTASSGSSGQLPQQRGFTIIELLIATFIIGTVVTGLFGLFVLNLRQAQESERRVIGIALANERAEMIRNLPYTNVGTVGGVPAGAILQQETVTRNGIPYTVLTDIRYIDDPYDGVAEAGGGAGCLQVCHQPPGQPDNDTTLCVSQSAYNAHINHGDSAGACPGEEAPGEPDFLNTDYKQARVEVKWQSPNQVRPIVLVLQIAPAGIEGGESAGTLDFQALSGAGVGVAGAQVQITNSATSPAINLTTSTNAEGRVVLPGLPENANTYNLAVSKSGYTSEQTYPSTATFEPDTDHAPLSMQEGIITPKTFFIDTASSVQITTRDPVGVAIPAITYGLRGSKTIGTTNTAQPVYVTDETVQTSALGAHTHSGLVWDVYSFTINSAAAGYDIQETSELLPFTVNAGESINLAVVLVPYTPISLHVTVASPTGEPVDNATVQLSGHGLTNQTLGTGVNGQVLYSNLPANGDYTLTVDAPLYTPFTGTVTVSNTSRTRVDMTLID